MLKTCTVIFFLYVKFLWYAVFCSAEKRRKDTHGEPHVASQYGAAVSAVKVEVVESVLVIFLAIAHLGALFSLNWS